MNRATAPVFIVGMNGSGTTMLLDSLGRHPDLYAFPYETRLIPSLANSLSSGTNLAEDQNFRALWEAVIGLHAFVRANGNCKLSLPENWRDFPRDLATVLDAVFRHFAAREGKTRWSEKTPQYAQHIRLLHQLFPDACFIHVVRDGRDCAVSFNRRWLRSPVLTMYRWKKVIAEARAQAQSLREDQYLEVKYEDLTANPEPWLRKICAFLHLPFDTAILQSSRPYLRSPGYGNESTPMPALQVNSGNWQSYFASQTQHQLEQIGGRMLHACGYATRFPEADRNLTPLQRRALAAKDVFMQFFREITLKLQGKIERPWHVILAKPIVAYRQRSQNRF